MALIDDIAMIAEIDKTKHNDYLATMIPILIEFAQEYCNITIEKDEITQEYLPPAGVKVFVAESIKHKLNSKGLSSRTMGSVSYTYDTDLPDKVKSYLKPYRKVRFI